MESELAQATEDKKHTRGRCRLTTEAMSKVLLRPNWEPVQAKMPTDCLKTKAQWASRSPTPTQVKAVTTETTRVTARTNPSTKTVVWLQHLWLILTEDVHPSTHQGQQVGGENDQQLLNNEQVWRNKSSSKWVPIYLLN